MATNIAPDQTCASWSARDVDVMHVERELSRLWVEVSRRGPAPNAVRTSVYNLIIHTDDLDRARHIVGEFSQLSQRRPSRAIVLVGDRLQPSTRLDAEVSVQCHRGAGDRALCHEQLIITAVGRAADHLASLVIPLLIPEIPTYLWWPGQPPFGHRAFHRLLRVANQFIVDSAEFTSPGDGMANVARICAPDRGVNDLNWARITPWREIITQFFDAPSYLPYARGIRSVDIEFGAGSVDFHRATSGLLLLLGWVARQLGWEPETTLDHVIDRDTELSVVQGERVIPVSVRFRDHGLSFAGRLKSVEIVSQTREAAPARFRVQREDDGEHGKVTVQVHEHNEIARIVPLVDRSEANILGDELEMVGHDGIYTGVVEMASRIAGREVWIPS